MTHRLVLAKATAVDETVPLTADDPPVIIEMVALRAFCAICGGLCYLT
ncbi:hypothetical protein [Micromonospora sp. NPDC007230]